MQLIKEKIQNLIRKLHYWEYLYYVKHTSMVSDEEYDCAFRELQTLERKYPDLVMHDSPTQRIGGGIFFKDNSNGICHKTPMLSLNRVVKKSQLFMFNKRVVHRCGSSHDTIISYCCELKIDGVAVSLLYRQGKLIYAATRGNGIIGEDITENVRTINSIPKFLQNINSCNNLPDLLEIRGEVFISKSCFLKLNNFIVKLGRRPFSNARNAASGSLLRLDSSITAKRFLSFYCYGISYCTGKINLSDSHCQRLQLCRSWGFPISDYINVVNNINEILQYYSYIQSIRSSLCFNIDGIVIKVDSCICQAKLGFGLSAPNWAISYKFPSEIQFTKIRRLIFQIGRTGVITPVAYLDPVVISDVVIRKVSVNNLGMLRKLGIMIGDTVRIQRSGDVIPKILEVVLSERSNHMQPIQIPYLCPECRSPLQVVDHQSVLRCMAGVQCSAQRKAFLKHFVSKKAMNIKGIGDKLICRLVDVGLIRTPVDLYRLEKLQLLNLLGKRSIILVERLLSSIEHSKKVTLSCFIYALGIRYVGEMVSKNLAIEFYSIENLISADLARLSHLKYVGQVVASNIYCFFNNPNNLKNVQDLIDPAIGIVWKSIV